MGHRRDDPIRPSPQGRVEAAALGYLARRPRTEAEVRAFLERKGASSGESQRLLRRFRRLGYVDDDAYARRWARDRLRRQPLGRDRLEAELFAKGLSQPTVAETIRELYDEVTERHLAARLLAAKAIGPAGLRRRGFSEETIAAVFGSDEVFEAPLGHPSRKSSRSRSP